MTNKYQFFWNTMEFEALIYVPQKAWALKHQSFVDGYPHHTQWSIETGSNPAGWKCHFRRNGKSGTFPRWKLVADIVISHEVTGKE